MIGRADDSGDSRCVDIDFDATTETGRRSSDRPWASPHRAAQPLRSQPGQRVRTDPAGAAGLSRGAWRAAAWPARAVWCEETPVAGRTATARLLDSHPRPDRDGGDERERGHRCRHRAQGARTYPCPRTSRSLSIVSSPRVAELVQPPLTTLHSPGVELGRLGVHSLLDQLDGVDPSAGPVLLPCRWEAGQQHWRRSRRSVSGTAETRSEPDPPATRRPDRPPRRSACSPPTPVAADKPATRATPGATTARHLSVAADPPGGIA